MKICTRCKIEKSFEEFARNNQRPNGIGSWCKECKNADRRRHRAENPTQHQQTFAGYYYFRGGKQKAAEGKLRRKYGLSCVDFEELSKDGCAICGTTENLCVDHDHSCCPGTHTCGKCIRGVLCNRHNKADGFLTSIEEIDALRKYRLKWGKK